MGEGGYEYMWKGHENVASSHRRVVKRCPHFIGAWGGHEIVGLLGTNYINLGQQFKKRICIAPLNIYNFSILPLYRPQCLAHN